MCKVNTTCRINPFPVEISQNDNERNDRKNNDQDHERSVNVEPELEFEPFYSWKNELVISFGKLILAVISMSSKWKERIKPGK